VMVSAVALPSAGAFQLARSTCAQAQRSGSCSVAAAGRQPLRWDQRQAIVGAWEARASGRQIPEIYEPADVDVAGTSPEP
jgi:hypothetical protein